MACRLFGAKPLPETMLNFFLVNWTLRNKLQWNSNRNTIFFIRKNAFENVVCEMVAILSTERWVNVSLPWPWLPAWIPPQPPWRVVTERADEHLCWKGENHNYNTVPSHERHDVSNHGQLDCLSNSLFWKRCMSSRSHGATDWFV